MNHPEYAQLLIQAVQSLSVPQLKNAIKRLNLIADTEVAHLRTKSDRNWGRRNYIDSTFGPLGLTALHVAAKAYAAHSTEHGQVFNEMVRILIKAGANPLMPIGQMRGMCWVGSDRMSKITDPGRTIIQECGGNTPRALRAFYRIFPGDDVKDTRRGETQKHESTKKKEARQVEKWRQSRKQVA